MNKWWDAYSGQKAIILDDLDKSHAFLGHSLKRWADRYAITGEVKGSTVPLYYEVIIVTSQYKIEQIWEDEETRSALRRRFETFNFDMKEHKYLESHDNF